MWLNSMVDDVVYIPRAERLSFDVHARYRRGHDHGTLDLLGLTPYGARTSGLAGLKLDDTVTLHLPSLHAKEARVAWVVGDMVGLEFTRHLHPDIYEGLILHHAHRRARSETDAQLEIAAPAAIH